MNQKAIVLTMRDFWHFIVSAIAAYGAIWIAQGQPTSKDKLLALIPAAATVIFRQFFPNLGSLTVEPVTPVPQYVPAPASVPTVPPSGVAS